MVAASLTRCLRTGNSTNRNGDAKTIAECCEACTKLQGCAVFVAAPNAIDGHGCVLWSATGVGGKVVKGAVTGSPRRADLFAGAAAAEPRTTTVPR